MNTIEQVKAQIEDIKDQIKAKQSEIDSFEYEVSGSEFDEFLDEIESEVTVCGMTFYPSDILKSCDPIAYRCAKSDYEANYDLDDCEEYINLKEGLEVLESELESLEEQLEELESEDE